MFTNVSAALKKAFDPDRLLDIIASEAEKGNPEAVAALERARASGDPNYEKVKAKLSASGPASTTLAPQKSMVSLDARRRRLMRSYQYGMMSTIKTGKTPGTDPAQAGPNYVPPTPEPIIAGGGQPMMGTIRPGGDDHVKSLQKKYLAGMMKNFRPFGRTN
jgi:hypothetical protein